MRTDETDTRIALQPETAVEQSILAELFGRLDAISEAPPHPEKVGNRFVFYTLDMAEYGGLDHDLADGAECGVNEHGQLDPEPGSRALVVVHDPEAEMAEEQPAEEADVEDTGGHATEEEIEDAVEGLSEGEDEENDHTVDANRLASEIADADLEDTDYRQLQAWAKDASTTGLLDIPANQSTDGLIDDLERFQELIDAPVEA